MMRCLLITPLSFYAFHAPIRAELLARRAASNNAASYAEYECRKRRKETERER